MGEELGPAGAGDQRRTDGYRVVVVASSAGGLGALTRLLGSLPADLAVPVLVVQHLDRSHPSAMAEILRRHTSLTVVEAAIGDLMRPGTVHIAPPDFHLLVAGSGELVLTHTELVHFVRPSADLLFESAAGAFGPAVLAVVLTGTGSDGAMGVRAVHERGGTVIVQDPATAEFDGMPTAAVQTGSADLVLGLEEIGPRLSAMIEEASGA